MICYSDGVAKTRSFKMKSLFTNGGTIKDVIVHMMHIMRSHVFHFFVFAIYHFEHIYLICGKIGHVIIWPCAFKLFLALVSAQVHHHIVWTMIPLKPQNLTFGSIVCNNY
jgi:hypothetical protein